MTRAALLLLLATVACGVKNRPLPPELVQPEAPTDLVAASRPEGVRLTWRRPTQYTGGKHMRDLGGFDIERATGADGIDFANVGRLELTDQTRFRQERNMTWTDTTAAVDTTYRYRVIAYTLDGYRSAPGGPLTITHHPGATVEAPPAPPHPTPAHRKRAPAH